MKEAAIRDYLAANIQLIEPHLELVRTEFLVPNANGAKGFIDILAKDKVTGMTVVIEIKKDDKSARSAIHELMKYVVLLKEQGCLPNSLRCLILSFTWHELLVPTSEYARIADYPVEGRQIEVDNATQTVQVTKKIALLKATPVLQTSSLHSCFLYPSNRAKIEAIATITQFMDENGVDDFLVVDMSYKGNAETELRFGIYLCTAQNFSGVIEDGFVGHELLKELGKRTNASIFEYSYPEKWCYLLGHWDIKEIIRSGRWKSTVIDDDSIRDDIGKISTKNSIQCMSACNIRFERNWKQLKKAVGQVLQFNSRWNKGTSLFFQEIEKLFPDATVSVNIFEPSNILEELYQVALALGDHQLDLLDRIEIAANLKSLPYLVIEVIVDSDRSMLLVGKIAWNGTSLPSPENVVNRACGNMAEFVKLNIGKQQGVLNEKLMKEMNLTFELVEGIFLKGINTELSLLNYGPRAKTIKRSPGTNIDLGSFTLFVAQNQKFLVELRAFMEQYLIQGADDFKLWSSQPWSTEDLNAFS